MRSKSIRVNNHTILAHDCCQATGQMTEVVEEVEPCKPLPRIHRRLHIQPPHDARTTCGTLPKASCPGVLLLRGKGQTPVDWTEESNNVCRILKGIYASRENRHMCRLSYGIRIRMASSFDCGMGISRPIEHIHSALGWLLSQLPSIQGRNRLL